MISLVQLYNLGLSENKNIFSGLRVPNLSPLDNDILINTILEKCGLNIPLYADVDTMSAAITLWSARNQYTFEHVAKIYEAEYSPIENYNKIETIGVNRTLKDDTSNKKLSTEKIDNNSNATVTENKTSAHSGTDTNTEENTTSAYNSSTYQPDNKTVTGLVHGETITDTGSGTTKNTGSSTKGINGTSNSNKNVTEQENTTNNTHGNIGVMTNTTMQTEEYELLLSYNPYNFLAGLFENELTLCIY